MSSNAFARSRPRVRQQRVHRITSCEHPRFMQLVNELARINEAKKKHHDEPYANNATTTSTSNSSTSSTSSSSSSSSSTTSCCDTTINTNSNTASCTIGATLPTAGTATSSSQTLAACCTSTGPQTYSTGYRSLESDQSTSAMNDNYTQIQQNHNIHHQHGHQDHHQNHPRSAHPHNNQSQLTQQAHHHQSNQQQLSNPHQNPQFSSNNNLQQQQQQHDDRCPVKAPSTNFGYSKQNLVELNNSPEFSNNNSASNANNGIPDLRQDENRSKRKRSTSEYPASKKNSTSSLCGSSGSGKRHKSSSDSIRPLSPSFTKCPICLLDTMDRDPSFTNTCFHLFCFVCIENWSKNKVTCPLCRTKFTKIIYNIKSATSFEEKATYPPRRDDEDNYIADRLMLEHLSTHLSSTSATSRNTGNTNNTGGNSDDVQFLFDNLRNTEVLAMPPYFVGQMDSRGPGESTLHSFNPVTASASFNSNVPHPSFSANFPIASNYIALFPQNNIPPTSTAIAHAYNSNTSINHLINDPNSRRISRSGRYLNSRNPDHPSVDYHQRTSSTRPTPSGSMNQDGMPMDRMPAHSQSHHHANPLQHNQHQDHLHHHHHQHQHQHQHHNQHQIQHSHQQQHHHHHAHLHHPSGPQTQQSHLAPPQQSQPPPPPQLQHQPPLDQHRSPIEMSSRQVQRLEQVHNNIPLSYSIPPRGLNQPVYMRRQFNNPHSEHPLMNNLYRNIPDF